MSQDTNKPDIRSVWESTAPAPGWLGSQQQAALENFVARGFPSRRLEDWKYTDVRDIAAAYPQWLTTQPAQPTVGPALLDIEDAIHIAFIDGHYSPQHSRTADLPEGLYAGDLSKAPQLESRYGTQAVDADNSFVALNTAFAGEGFALLLDKGRRLDQPVYLSFTATTAELTVQPRIIIDLGESAAATVIEHYTSNVAALTNTVTEIRCAPNSSLKWDKLQDEHPGAWHLAAQYAELGRDATLTSTDIALGAALARSALTVKLTGSGAHAEARGLFMADASRHVENRLTVEHAAPHTTSRERYRAVLADKARGVFNGRILVQQEAQKTSADLTNRNLLLSPGAEINTKPELEIYADDVKCAHGSTTGQLDETSLFYLLSRGIDQDAARAMLVTAFASELLIDLGFPQMLERVQATLNNMGRERHDG